MKKTITNLAIALVFPRRVFPFKILNLKMSMLNFLYFSLSVFVFPLLGGAGVGYAQVCFSAATNFAVGTTPRSITKADFNGDGKLDLAVGNSVTNNVSVSFGNGVGGFIAPTSYSVGSVPRSISSADFNGDGKADLAVANSTSNTVSVLLNTGTGSFAIAVNYTVGTAPVCLISTDLNGDGKVDIATANSTSNNVSVLLGNGTGVFGATTNYAAGTAPAYIVYADYNSDTFIDLAVDNGSLNNVLLLTGNGTGSFTAGVNFGVGNAPVGMVTADFNGDGKFDIATANQTSNDVSILIGTGTGSFNAAVNYTVATQPLAVTAADFNGDGKLDLATANFGSSNVSVLQGTGTGSFGSGTIFSAGSACREIISADFNGDTKIDLAVVNQNSNNYSILLNTRPIVNISGSSTICSGTSTILTASGASTYTWSANAGSATTATVSLSPPGTTVYTVTGSTGACTNTQTIVVNVNNTPTVSVNSASVCVGNSTVLTASGAGTYTWSTGANTSAITVAPSSITVYSVTGTTGSCSKIATSTVTVNPLPVISSVSVTPATCGYNDGSANATVTGAGSPFTYQWSSGKTKALADSLFSGQYQLTVSNTFGCATSTLVTINSGNGPIVSLSNATNNICPGGSTGSLTVSVTGGTAPYTYAWTTGAATKSINNLLAGTYIVTVTDNAGCKVAGSYVVTQPAPISIQFTVTPSACAGSTGSAKAVVSGGTAGYTYLWSANAASQTTATATGLAAGIYSVVVTDLAGCQKNASVIVSTITAGASIVLDSIKAGRCGINGPGSIYITVSGGLFPYTYNWSNGATTKNITGIAPGTYSVGVVDANGCMTYTTYVVPNANQNYQPQICLVTYDTASGSNLIAWEKTGAVGIKKYNIYCEIGSYNNYQLVGSLPAGNLSEYIHVGANPNVKSWKYKISAVDSCGTESPLSSYHKTIHLQINPGTGGKMNLSWDNYYGFNYTGFEVWRFHPTTNWVQLTSIPFCGFIICPNSYTDIAPIVGDTNRYAILVVPPSPCITTTRLVNPNGISTAIVRSKSNITNNRMTGIGVQQWATGSGQVTIYPNPVSGIMNVEFGIQNGIQGTKYEVQITNVLGTTIYSATHNEKLITINLSEAANGVYFVKVISNGSLFMQKLIVQR